MYILHFNYIYTCSIVQKSYTKVHSWTAGSFKYVVEDARFGGWEWPDFSKVHATCSSVFSSYHFPINCSPTGRPSLERPIGQLIAGFPVKLARLTDRPCGYLK